MNIYKENLEHEQSIICAKETKLNKNERLRLRFINIELDRLNGISSKFIEINEKLEQEKAQIVKEILQNIRKA